MPEKNINSTTTLPTVLRPTPDESGMTVPQLLEHRINTLFEQIPLVAELGEAFARAGHDLYLVGGSVRDALMGRLGHDLDFTTDARPDDTEAILRQHTHATWDIGRAFGTIGAQIDDWVVEVTTYRADAYHPDSRKPEIVYGETLEDDLIRRDFTVNAMALHAATRTFSDPYAGLTDIVSGILRTPFPPERSFSDDPLRMMRAARFTSQLGFTVTNEVRAAMTDMASRIEIISAERVRDELSKTLLTDHPREGLDLLVTTRIADYVLPELPALRLERDEHHRHKDVYEHSLTVLDQSIDLEKRRGHDPDLTGRLAALLHDIGKPSTRKFEPGGKVSFHHHDIVGAKMARKRLKALIYPSQVVKEVSKLVELHLRFHGYGDQGWTDSAVRRYVRDAGDQLERLHILTRSDCTTRNRRKAERLEFAYDDLEARIANLTAKEELAAIRPDLDGQQIMATLDIKPGPEVGKAYKFLLNLRLDEGPHTLDEAKNALLAWWATQDR
ncbi:CCA tRNA nucleotidyltransferase [Leptospira kmetyi]|uniref:CCA tRNA nucleotidyltransferase n=2 Tax=Propionibacteriaceae TaxID=31957 RepID=UPI0001C19F93|nr:tRNA adenylyltransferase [Cutibacterium acnes subsp. defendens ATCC 11828]ALU24330.1 CCA tRNA nucleotidyltransferase [Cutibacterium acnes]EFB87816.1 tRNA adenylyltransferase [Cutibacterium acnes J139]KFC14576.1 tRNA adenylyltransferase [Cutibacterium acnes HL202PA1]MBX7472281.1 CCA tRNA nucleotidyltransferase [Streptomyces sp. MAG02]OFK54226.1 CCA tRNA nucleotidyltransferase [Propionibacterium sp. HMSC069G10]PGF30294.1 CCA tRNA nucleotidyltransferase [Cutibacterium acnes subsp. defendens]